MIITPKYKIKQESLDDFSATIAAKPNLSKAEIFKKFPEFNNDEGMLQAVMDYHATAMSGKYKDLETLNSRFPELQFDYVKKKPESDVQFPGQVDLLQNSGNGSQPISQEPPKESELMDNGLTEEADKQKALQDLADQAKQQGIPEAKVVDQPPFPGQVDLGKPVETGLTAEQDFEKNKERNPAATLGKTLWNTMRYQLPADLIGGQMALEDLPKDLNEAVFNPVFNKLDDKSEPTNTESPGWLNKVMSFITHKPTEKEKADMEARRGEPSEIDLHRKQMLSQALDLKKDGNEANKYLVNSLGKADDFLDYMNWAGAAIGQGVGQIPTAVATKGASAFGQEIGTIYLDGVQELAKEKGTSPEEIIKSGQDESIFPVLFGFGAGALDLIGAKGVMKSFSKDQVMKSLRERGLGFLKVAGKESLTEGGQSILEQLGVKKAAGQTWEEAFKSIDPKDIAESMAQGFVAGGGLHAIGSGVNNLSNKKSQDNAVQEPSTGSILQQPQEGTGGEGSQRSGVEPSQQWNQIAAKEEPVKVADDTKKEKVDEPVAEPKTETQGVVEGGTDPVVQKSAADQKIESGKQKVAKGVESLVAKLGAIKNVNPLDDTSAWDDIKSILDGLSDMGIAKTEQVIEYLKKELGKHGIKPEDIDAKKDQIEAHLNPPFVKEQGKKSLLGRAHEGTTKEEVKASIEKHGLNYEPESFIHAKDKATKFIEDVGFDAALEAVRKSQVEDGAAAFVWSELIDQVGDRIAESKDDAEKSQLVDMEGELLSEFDRKARSGGRFISALQDVYANSDFGYKLSVQVQQYKDKNNGVISPEVEAKFKELDTQLTEAKEKRAEAEKRAQKAEEDLAIANIKEAAAREKTKKVSSVRIKAARDTRDKLKSEFFSLYNPAKSGGKLMASAVPGATLLQYGVKIANTYVQEGIVRLEDVIAKTKEYFEKELGHALSDADLGSIQAKVSKVSEKLNRLIEKEGKIKIYHDTIRDLVASGVDTIEGLTTAVKDLVKDTHPNVTDREIRDAITGYGRVSNPNQEEIEVQIRKMTRVGRVISAMEDIKEKKRPLRSGQQRDRLDAEERSLNKELRAAMRDLPMDEEAEAEQLKNSLDAIKTRLRNHIEDLEREIETGQKSAKARGVELDEDAKKIEAERDQIKEIHESIFGKGTDKDQRIEATLRATERAITETIRRIDQNDLESKKAGKWSSPDVVAARERLGRLKDRLLGLQEEAGIPERNRLEAAKKRATKKIEDLNERLRTGNFAKRPKPTPLVKDTELSNLDAEIVRIKEEYAKEQYKVELKNRTKVQKAVDALVEVWGLSRVLRATGEFSFVLIQNWIYTISHPITAAKAVATAFNHFISPEKSEKFLNHIRAQEYYPRVKATKLAIAETDVKLSAREEMFIGSWGNKLWDLVGYALTGMGKWKPAYEKWKAASPLKAFERAGTGFLNTVRLTRYLEGEEMLRMQGKDFNSHPEEYKDLADVVNTFTGRASLGPFDRIATPLAVIFFSPRNWASILKQATPYAFYHFGKMTTKEGGVSVAQKMAMADYLKAVSATTAIMMLIEYGMSDEDKEKYGVSIEMDPRSTDFMKVKIGKTRLDPWGGRQQMIVLQARLIMNSLKNDKGQVKTLGEDQHTSTGIDLLGKMAKNKLAPSTGLAFKFLDKHNKNIKGKNVWVDEYGNELFESPEANLYPIYAETVAELYKDQPELIASMITFMSFWGLGSQTYDNMDTKKKKMEFYKRKFSE